MFLYESKKPAASAKKNSSNKSTNTNSSRRVHFNSTSLQLNQQELKFIIPKSPVVTAMPPKAENRYAAGSARPPHNGLLPDYSSDNDVNFIEKVLSSDNWRESIESDKEIFSCAEQIRGRWEEFLPKFLESNGFQSYGANQSLTYHRPGSNDTAESLERRDIGKTSKLKRLYKCSSGIRTRRKYPHCEEIKRYLRHCAAMIKIDFGIESEIQCYYDDENKVVYIAVNTQEDERKISKINGKYLSGYWANLQCSLRKTNDISAFWVKAEPNTIRLSDRKVKLLFRRLRHTLTCPKALSRAKIHIIKSSEVNVKIPGLHAERKILYYLRSQKNNDNIFLNPMQLGGIRRPCFVCSALCFADMSQVNPGPCWASAAASTPKDVKEMFLILYAIKNKANTTNVSDNCEHLTMDNDTESSEGSECDQDIER